MSQYDFLPPAVRDNIAMEEGRDTAAIVVLKIYEKYESRVLLGDDGKPVLVNGEMKMEMQPVHWVKWGKRGDQKHGGEDRIRLVQKDRELWPVIRPAYEAWQKGQEAPVNGHPIHAWAAITPEYADMLRSKNIRTVQDMAAATDGDLDGIGMGARSLRDKARAFLKAESQSAAAEIMASQAAEIETLKQRDADRDQAMSEMKAQLAALVTAAAKNATPKRAA